MGKGKYEKRHGVSVWQTLACLRRLTLQLGTQTKAPTKFILNNFAVMLARYWVLTFFSSLSVIAT